MNAGAISRVLRSHADADIARHAQRFFKTGRGGYGEGDRFLGIRVPVLRQHVRQFRDADLEEVLELLTSPFHEERLMALLLLVDRYGRGSVEERGHIYKEYLGSTRFVNNWDLVDSSADRIVGAWLAHRSRRPLYKLAKSKSPWERRIAIMATFHFIRHNDFDDTLALCVLLLDDDHDLVHKAAGWMLREIGKRDEQREKAFLDRYCAYMPRTMLRYAIERLPQADRRAYLECAKSARTAVRSTVEVNCHGV